MPAIPCMIPNPSDASLAAGAQPGSRSTLHPEVLSAKGTSETTSAPGRGTGLCQNRCLADVRLRGRTTWFGRPRLVDFIFAMELSRARRWTTHTRTRVKNCVTTRHGPGIIGLAAKKPWFVKDRCVTALVSFDLRRVSVAFRNTFRHGLGCIRHAVVIQSGDLVQRRE
jgi:hypothetical protein